MVKVTLFTGDITDRTQASDGDCVIVTGSIGPQFEPLLFKRKADADAYARHICKVGKAANVWPRFQPIIETRWADDMRRFPILDRFDKSTVWCGK